MQLVENLEQFYKDKKVLVTGHTGFKGAWLTKMLINMGAKVCGFALEPPTEPSLYNLLQLDDKIISVTGDIRNLSELQKVFDDFKPEIVLHLAAQPIVRESYKNPVYTYETNVMGTVNILEGVRNCESVISFLNVTTDKVYENKEWCWGYRENEALNGYDPYSNSKSCSELVTSSYYNSVIKESKVSISTARAGNVIGGGDFAPDRIIPDCVRAAIMGQSIIIRNPYSVRPFQHVLEPLSSYLYIAMKQYNDKSLEGNYNIGPEEHDCVTAGTIADTFTSLWGDGLEWINKHDGGPHEATLLKLDCSKIKQVFGIRPVWNITEALAETVEWYKCYANGEDISACMDRQIERYMSVFYDR